MVTSRLIENFIDDSSKPTISVVDLLEQARTIACVLGDKKFAKFCEKELNGYAENEKVPDYRQIGSIRQIWYDGPLIKEADKDAPKYGVNNYLMISCRNPIKYICTVVESGKNYVSAPWDDDKFFGYKNRTIIELHFLQKIECEVRIKINDWKITNIKNGTFSVSDDKDKGGNTIIYNNGGTNLNNFGNMENTSIQTTQIIDLEKISNLIDQISQNIKALHLPEVQENGLNSDISEIKDMIAQKDESGIRKVLRKIDSICQNITGNVVAAGIIAEIASILG